MKISKGDIISNVEILEVFMHETGTTKSKIRCKYLCCGEVKTIAYTTLLKRMKLEITKCHKCATKEYEDKERIRTPGNHFTDEENRIYNMWRKY